MSPTQRNRPVELRVVGERPRADDSDDARLSAADGIPSAADVDWTILMARAQRGDAAPPICGCCSRYVPICAPSPHASIATQTISSELTP